YETDECGLIKSFVAGCSKIFNEHSCCLFEHLVLILRYWLSFFDRVRESFQIIDREVVISKSHRISQVNVGVRQCAALVACGKGAKLHRSAFHACGSGHVRVLINLVNGTTCPRKLSTHAALLTSSTSARYDSASARCTRPTRSAPSRSASVRATRSTR